FGVGVRAEVDVDEHATRLGSRDGFQEPCVMAERAGPLPQVGEAARVDADEHDVRRNLPLQQAGSCVGNAMLEWSELPRCAQQQGQRECRQSDDRPAVSAADHGRHLRLRPPPSRPPRPPSRPPPLSLSTSRPTPLVPTFTPTLTPATPTSAPTLPPPASN